MNARAAIACLALIALGGLSRAFAAPSGPGQSQTVLLTSDFVSSARIALLNDGRLVISEVGAVGVDGTLTFDGALLGILPNGSTYPVTTGMLNPQGVVRDADGALFIADAGPRSETNDGDGVIWRAAGDGSPAVLFVGNYTGGGPLSSPGGLLPHPSDPTRVLVAEKSGTPPLLPIDDGGILSFGRDDASVAVYFDDGVGGLSDTTDLASAPGGGVLASDIEYGEITRVTPPATRVDVSSGLSESARVVVSPAGKIYAREYSAPALYRLGPGGVPAPFITVSSPGSAILDAVVEHETSIIVLVSGPEKGVYRVLTCPPDVAPPFGVLDLMDVNAFVIGFLVMSPDTDLNHDGLHDLVDVNLFIQSFLGGCP
ncbi:MAG: hypothetical protein H6810_04925 [Phycisphaeraceae bacterium]|nr:MAG: hypothetical protein H6810_04925 [Phycisphaeraceae bacterium]